VCVCVFVVFFQWRGVDCSQVAHGDNFLGGKARVVCVCVCMCEE
jgi:hypothetical protein